MSGGVFISIESAINKFLASPEGKKRVEQEKKKALKEGRKFGQPEGATISKTDAEKAAQKMKNILLKHLATVNLQTIFPDDIVVGEPKIQSDGTISIDISFDSEAVKRPSLAPEKYDGVENIVVHLTHGWDANGSVHGYWESAGRMAWSRQSFVGDDFMQHAVEEFNSLKLGKAELNEKYL
ncbi:hypothetical protein SDC9_41252 [bioreactor metagenome]|uniref:Uncharacterized protein n=1 Tax=bioreactor metagenome TaxID=1076179 RepID=A0A644VUK3_9ZZZZ